MLPHDQTRALHSCHLARWSSNWLRLSLLLLSMPSSSQAASERSSQVPQCASFGFWTFIYGLGLDRQHTVFGFWNFPEGTLTILTWSFWFVLALLVWILVVCWVVVSCTKVAKAPGRLLWISFYGFCLAEAMAPQSTAEGFERKDAVALSC